MSLTTLAWLAMAAYSAHILEEYMLDWRNWARGVLKLPVEWSDFYVTNSVVVALGVAQAELAAALPLAALSFAALMLINALLFHIAPFARTGKFSPGTFTAVLLFLPCGVATFWHGLSTGAASALEAIFAVVIGALTMAYPIVMLKVKSKPFFRQDAAA